MSNVFNGLLAMDRMASQVGCSLHPKLREALEAHARFPARSSGPLPDVEDIEGNLPENVTRLTSGEKTKAKREA